MYKFDTANTYYFPFQCAASFCKRFIRHNTEYLCPYITGNVIKECETNTHSGLTQH